MNEPQRELAHRIVQKVIAWFEGDSGALEDLVESLQAEGATAESIREALEWLHARTARGSEPLLPSVPGSGMRLRVLSAEERELLTAEAYGYLLGLAADGRAGGELVESILARLGETGLPVNLERMQELAWRVATDGTESEGDDGRLGNLH